MEKIIIVAKQTPIKLLTMEYPPARGGAGVYCEELAHTATNMGANLEVLAPRCSHTKSPVKIFELPFKGSQGWGCSLRIRKILQKIKLHEVILHIADSGALRAMIRFGWTLPKPARLIITIHGSEIPKFSRNPIEVILFKNLLKRSEKIHVLSKFNQKKVIQFFPQIKNRIFLIPGAPARRVLPNEIPLLNRNYNREHLVLLCVGRIHPRKGQFELLNAVEQLPSHLKELITCRFVGPYIKQGYAKKVLHKAKSVGCEVQFSGDLNNEDLKRAYQDADLFALTSIPKAKSVEGFGFVYLEASAHGLPILAHRVGGVDNAVIDGKTGVLCEPDKPDQLKEKLRQLIENPEMRMNLGKAGMKWAALHNWKDVAQKLYDFD